MARLAALRRENLEEFEPIFQMVEKSMGFVPNSMLTLAQRPEFLRGFAALAGPVLGPGQIEPELKQLIAFVSSRASGCRYCQAHTSFAATHLGAARERIDAAFEFDRSPLFSGAERTALQLAHDASLTPNATTDAHFDQLRQHYSEDQILEICAVISLFGWLNRWNDTVATELETEPLSFAQSELATQGWEPGRHRP